MKKLINILKNKEIMGRIVFTIMILFIFRLGAQITVPGVTIPADSDLGNYLTGNNPLSLMNLLGGGTLQSFSIFALGVSPYITAQIIVQLVSVVIPSLEKLHGYNVIWGTFLDNFSRFQKIISSKKSFS